MCSTMIAFSNGVCGLTVVKQGTLEIEQEIMDRCETNVNCVHGLKIFILEYAPSFRDVYSLLMQRDVFSVHNSSHVEGSDFSLSTTTGLHLNNPPNGTDTQSRDFFLLLRAL